MQTNKGKDSLLPFQNTWKHLYKLQNGALGLVDDQVEENRDIYGENVITKVRRFHDQKIYESIINHGDFVGRTLVSSSPLMSG